MNRRRRFKAKRRRYYKRRDLYDDMRDAAAIGMTLAEFHETMDWLDSADGRLFGGVEVIIGEVRTLVEMPHVREA
jgi:hypothetical protein